MNTKDAESTSDWKHQEDLDRGQDYGYGLLFGLLSRAATDNNK